MTIPDSSGHAPYVTTEQMIEVDRAMIQHAHIELLQMMENAGRNLAHLARVRFLAGNPRAKAVLVLAGTGGNGGARRRRSFSAILSRTSPQSQRINWMSSSGLACP